MYMPDGTEIREIDGKIDEIVASNFHLEQMDTNAFWFQINDTHVWLGSTGPINIEVSDCEGRVGKEQLVPLREKLAELEHIQWAAWTKYFIENLTPKNIERWQRQIDTPYAQLTEKEKDSDREWADKVLDLFKRDEE